MSGSSKSDDKKSKTKELSWMAAIVILILALLGAGYFYVKSKHPQLLGQ
jgi:hypothetical protein